MDRLIWSDSFIVGHCDIDNQHRHLLSILNGIADLDCSDINATQYCYSILNRFSKNADEHFEFEKNLLRHAGAWDLSDQIIEQNKMYLLLKRLQSALMSQNITIPALHEQLLDMFKAHLTGKNHPFKPPYD